MTTAAVDFTKVTPVAEMQGDDDDETASLHSLAKEAANFLSSFTWCTAIKNQYLGIGVPGVIGVFLFEQQPSDPTVDRWLWVIVGDLPPAYITIEDAPNPACALDAYIGAVTEWVSAAKRGLPVDNLIPVNAPPTMKYAEMLESRLSFLDREILSYYAEDLK